VGENLHEHSNPAVRALYPDGMHTAIAQLIGADLPGAQIRTATLDQPEHGLTTEHTRPPTC
jgi:trehalose utilization protein